MKNELKGAIIINPMVAPGLCLRLNNWLHSRHYVCLGSNKDTEKDLIENTLFGFQTRDSSWRMNSITKTIENLSNHGFDPMTAMHLVGLMDEDRELDQTIIRDAFSTGDSSLIENTIKNYNTQAYPETNSFFSGLSIVNDAIRQRSLICWDQVSEVNGLGLEIWLRMLTYILNQLYYTAAEGMLCETKAGGMAFETKENGIVSATVKKHKCYIEYEEERRKVSEHVEKMTQSQTSKLNLEKQTHLLIPSLVETNRRYFSGHGEDLDPFRYMSGEDIINDFRYWLLKEMDFIDDEIQFKSFREISSRLALDFGHEKEIARYLSTHPYTQATINKVNMILDY